MSKEDDKSWIVGILPDALAFAVGLGVAYFLKWQTRDLVWSLWLCSLVLGYLTILSILGGGAYEAIHAFRQQPYSLRQSIPAILIGVGVGAFFLGFFSLHFCGFHAGHSVFLQLFFPLEGVPRDGFGEAFMNPPRLWAQVFHHLLKPYGLFLIPAIIAERNHVFRPLLQAISWMRTTNPAGASAADETDAEPARKGNAVGDAMGRPYLNIIRMHLLIFFFAICHAVKIDSFFVYAVVYFVYFFPWATMKERRAAKGPLAVPQRSR